MDTVPNNHARLLRNLVGFGTIAATDAAAWAVRVDLGGRLTGWLRMPGEIGRNFKRWRPLRVGTQVLVACPSGDPANAVIVAILNTTALPPPATDPPFCPDIDLIAFEDGTLVRHDSKTGHTNVHSKADLTVTCGGDLNLTCGGEMRLQADGDMWLDAAHVHVHEGG